MDRVEEILRSAERRLRGLEPGDPGKIDELERLVGRPLPRELRAYLRLAGGNPGNLTFVQTHKTVVPTLADAIAAHRPTRHGRRKKTKLPASSIFFGDGDGCQDCGPAMLVLSAEALPKVEIDPEDPPVAGFDDDERVLLEPRFSDYLRRAIPR